MSKAQLAGVALLAATTNVRRNAVDMAKRLIWTESNTDRVRRATVHGTRIQDMASVPKYVSAKKSLIWPRAVVAGKLAHTLCDLLRGMLRVDADGRAVSASHDA